MSNTKDFKYTLKSKEGKILLQSIVTFGSEEKPFPKDWKSNPLVQMAIVEHKRDFINDNFDIEIDDENLDFDIKDKKETMCCNFCDGIFDDDNTVVKLCPNCQYENNI